MKTIDLFCGCGGMSLGFQKVGFDVVLAIDNWQAALDVYKANLPHTTKNMDLTDVQSTVKTIEPHRPDVIIGGPPCQDFSQAGKRNEDLGRGNLTISFAEIVAKVKPKYFVMENVDRLLKTKKYGQAYLIFREAGYGVSTALLDASFYGVPQKRKRYFVVGLLDEENGVLDNALKDGASPKPLTVRDYFGSEMDFEFYYRHPRNYSRRAVYSVDEPSPTIRGVNRPIPAGYKIRENDATDKLDSVVVLTTAQRSLLQTFPPNFKLIGSKTDLEQMIGNAVPVKLAEHVGNCLMRHIESSPG